jgi:hypothetical protein
MNTINVTVELCPEDRARLDKILETLQGIHPNCHSCTQTDLEVMGENLKIVTGQDPEEEPQEAPRPLNLDDIMPSHPAEEVGAAVEPEPAAAPEPEAPKYTKADVQALVQKLAAPTSPEHKRTGAKAIVKSYGAKVSDIPEEKYAEVMDKLTALDKEG